MTAKNIRIVMILLTAFIASLVLPDLYRTSFRRNSSYVSVNFSEVTKQFYITGIEKGYVVDTMGNKYKSKDIEHLFPTATIAQLVKNKKFPDSIQNVAVTPQLLSENSFQHRIPLHKIEKEYRILPLTSGSSDEVGYRYTNDMMRVGKRGIEFYNSATNQVDSAKSALFDKELKQLNYLPPAKKLYGVYSSAKRRDDGLFFVDSNDKLFQVRYFDNEPICKEIPLPADFTLKKMVCQSGHPEIIAYLIGEKEIFLLKVNHQLLRLDLDSFDYDTFQTVDVVGNLFYRLVSLDKDGYEKLFVFDRNYKLVGSHDAYAGVYEESFAGKIESFLFPFTAINYSYLTGFEIKAKPSPMLKFIWLNMLLAIGLLFYKRTNGLDVKNGYHIIDLLLVLFLGIYGLIGTLIYPIRE